MIILQREFLNTSIILRFYRSNFIDFFQKLWSFWTFWIRLIWFLIIFVILNILDLVNLIFDHFDHFWSFWSFWSFFVILIILIYDQFGHFDFWSFLVIFGYFNLVFLTRNKGFLLATFTRRHDGHTSTSPSFSLDVLNERNVIHLLHLFFPFFFGSPEGPSFQSWHFERCHIGSFWRIRDFVFFFSFSKQGGATG